MSGPRDDELALLRAVLSGEWPRHAAKRLGIPPKRVRYLCERKWTKGGRYEYGVVCDLGWLTPKGKAWAAELLGIPEEPANP